MYVMGEKISKKKLKGKKKKGKRSNKHTRKNVSQYRGKILDEKPFYYTHSYR